MPKIVDLELMPLEFTIPEEKAYGTSRGLNFRRQSSLVDRFSRTCSMTTILIAAPQRSLSHDDWNRVKKLEAAGIHAKHKLRAITPELDERESRS